MEHDDEIQSLIDEGCCTRKGDLLHFNWPKFRILHPTLAEDIWTDHLREVDKAIMSLVDKGLLEMDVQWEGDEPVATFSITTDAKAILDNPPPVV